MELNAHGPPGEIITESLVEQVLRLRCRVVLDPVSGTPMVLPIGRHKHVSIEASDRVPVHRASRW